MVGCDLLSYATYWGRAPLQARPNIVAAIVELRIPRVPPDASLVAGERSALAVNTGRPTRVYTFRTPCVCLQRRVLRTLQQRQRNDRKADFRCGANPQRGELSWVSRQKICDPSPAFLPLATSVIATNSGAPLFNLTVPKLRAVMDTRLTAMRTENGMETAMRKEIDELSRMTVGQLRQKYLEAFGEESRSNHKQFLFRRIA